MLALMLAFLALSPIVCRAKVDAKAKRDFSPRRPTRSQEANVKEKASACSVRNDGWAAIRVENEGELAAQSFELWMASQTAEVTSRVVALPPRSGVWRPEAVTRSTARINRRAASFSPRCSSISAAVQKAPMGLAMPLPVMSKAAP
jgi:hypothetical protein